jgi:pseudaminic acid synthase
MTGVSDVIDIGGRIVGPGHPVFVIAELSANHAGDYERAADLVRVAAEAGADAVKLQTYTPDTMTIACEDDAFRIGEGTEWAGRNLYDLYTEAQTPWEWHEPLKELAESVGLQLFSSPFDRRALRFLDELGVPAIKIASFEIVDLALVGAAAATGRPLILSTGMATKAEITEAVSAARAAGGEQIALLRCNSAYPAPAAEMDLRTIPDMASEWRVPIGLSDHTVGLAAAVAAVALGASLLEKHVTLSRSEPGPDRAFSLEPHELKVMVEAVRAAEQSLGTVRYGPSEHEHASLAFRRSLFVVADVTAGERFTTDNVRAIRPGAGLAPKHLDTVLARRAARDLRRGTPLTWDALER